MTVLPFATQIKNAGAAIEANSPIKGEVIFCVRGVISPLLANLYFRRFLLAWNSHGHRDRLGAYVVNYADDFVICCRLRHLLSTRQRGSGSGDDAAPDDTARAHGE